MNSFALLQVDSDDEDTKVTKKTTVESKGAAKKAPAARIPGAAPAKKGGKQPSIAAAVVRDVASTDPTGAGKVNDRGGKSNERYGHEARGRGAGKGDDKKKHQYDKTAKGKESRGGRGPGNWGSHDEEARTAAKNPAAALDDSAPTEDTEAEAEPVEAAPTVFGFDDMAARREAARANSELFGSVKERTVAADNTMKVAQKEVYTTQWEGKGAKVKAQKEQKTKVVLQTAFTVAPAEEPETRAPRENRDSRDRDSRGRGGRGGGRDNGRSAGRGAGRGRGGESKSALRADDFPAL